MADISEVKAVAEVSAIWWKPYVNKLVAIVAALILGIVSALGTIILDKVESLASKGEELNERADRLVKRTDQVSSTVADTLDELDKTGQKVTKNNRTIEELKKALAAAEADQARQDKAIQNANQSREDDAASLSRQVNSANSKADKAGQMSRAAARNSAVAKKNSEEAKKAAAKKNSPTPAVTPSPQPPRGICALGLCQSHPE